MLFRKNLKQTVKLSLLDLFVSNEFNLTSLIYEFYDECFSLFESLLFKFEQKKLVNENEFEL